MSDTYSVSDENMAPGTSEWVVEEVTNILGSKTIMQYASVL